MARVRDKYLRIDVLYTWGGLRADVGGKFSKLLVIMSAISNGAGYRFAGKAERKDSWN